MLPPERRLLWYEGRVKLRVQVRLPERELLRQDERAQVRGPVLVRERGHERTSYPDPERQLLRAPEQESHKGQEFPLWSGG